MSPVRTETTNELSKRPAFAAAVLIDAGSTFIAGADIRRFGHPAKEPRCERSSVGLGIVTDDLALLLRAPAGA